MLVKDAMSTNVTTISADRSLLEARELMKGGSFRRIPVVDDVKRVMGIITETDVGKASPTEASTLGRYEANYLLGKIKVREVMTRDVITVRSDIGVEDAAYLMLKHKISSIPVVDDNNCLCGIITDSDLFREFVSIMGITQTCTRITIEYADKVGVMAQVGTIFAERGINIISCFVKQKNAATSEITLRADLSTSGMEIIEELREAGFNVIDVSTVRGLN